MIPANTLLCSPSFSYLVNYEIQSSLYDWFDKITNDRDELKVPTVCVCCVSTMVTTATRISGVVETFFGGFLILFCIPFNKKFDEGKLGLHEIFVHTPKNILRMAVIPFEFIHGLIFSLCEPKFFILIELHQLKVNLIHAKEGTIGTKPHKVDMRETEGTSYGNLIKWQGERRVKRAKTNV